MYGKSGAGSLSRREFLRLGGCRARGDGRARGCGLRRWGRLGLRGPRLRNGGGLERHAAGPRGQVQSGAQGRVPGRVPRDARRHGAVLRPAEDRAAGRRLRDRRHRRVARPVRRERLDPGRLRPLLRERAPEVPAGPRGLPRLRGRHLRRPVVHRRGDALLPPGSPRRGRLLRTPRHLGGDEGNGPQGKAGHRHEGRLRLPGCPVRGRHRQRPRVHLDARGRRPERRGGNHREPGVGGGPRDGAEHDLRRCRLSGRLDVQGAGDRSRLPGWEDRLLPQLAVHVRARRGPRDLQDRAGPDSRSRRCPRARAGRTSRAWAGGT
jgi:hypothetical protein